MVPLVYPTYLLMKRLFFASPENAPRPLLYLMSDDAKWGGRMCFRTCEEERTEASHTANVAWVGKRTEKSLRWMGYDRYQHPQLIR